MAPVTRRSHESFTNFNMYNDANEESSNAVTNDPWSIESGNELETGSHSAGFEDSFIVPADPQNDSNVSKSYQKNKEYLEYLESKLQRIERNKIKVQKITASGMISSLCDVKEKHMQWNMSQGIVSSEDELIDSDSSGGGHSLTNELRRKMFPEQQALNDTELLRLLDHDIIEKVIGKQEN